MNTKKMLSLVLWIVLLVMIGYGLGLLTKASVNDWYQTLNRSPLSPPNYVFGIVWTILYIMLGISGWLIWQSNAFPGLGSIKRYYVAQLILNWSWTPLFFYYHQIDFALICILFLTLLVTLLIVKCFRHLTKVSLLLIPYSIWLLFASYLNLYIVLHN